MLAFDQSRRIDQIRPANGIENVRDRNAGRRKPHRIWGYLKFRHPSTLDDYCGHPIQPIHPGLDVVGGNFPQPVRRYGIRCQAVTDDRKDREGQPVRIDFCGRWELGLQPGHDRIHSLQGQHHIGVPVEEKIHLRRSPAGD